MRRHAPVKTAAGVPRPVLQPERIEACLLRDAEKLRRRAGQGVDGPALERELAAAERRARRRCESIPRPKLDSGLPILAMRREILAALADQPVIVVAGATGSGKSTQLPQLAIAAGRGRRGYIGHTQPRRVATTALARRIAQELGGEVGGAVGYRIRFRDRVSADSVIKLVTDGMLLAEVQSDPQLLAYDTLILDEAHERNLNVDFLLGYLKNLLPVRPDLRIIITSATIDASRFARFFGDAPVLEIPGRSHPVDVRYLAPTADCTLEDAVADAALSLVREGWADVLAFLPGEREIRRTARRLVQSRGTPAVQVLPLFARLARREQERIFSRSEGAARIVLATNVAETSLTVPGIRSVVDSGVARIARYVPHSAIERLPVEPIARASAEQRKGRAGRTRPGVCIRLYEEQDFEARPEYTEPEILRAGLDGVLLRMAALGLGAAETFPFLDPPNPKSLRAGYRDLVMLGAFDADRRLTTLGRRLARLPLDPRLARILFAAVELGAESDALTVVSALAAGDPRERPLAAAAAADAAHQSFASGTSDFATDLELWEWYQAASKRLSRRTMDAELRRRFLAPARMREWAEVRRELARLLGGAERIRERRERSRPEALHRAVLAGFLDRVAVLAEEGSPRSGAYRTARGRHVDIHPASVLARRRPRFIVAAQLLDTGRLYAHHVAAVKPEWIEEAGSHVVERVVEEPQWDPGSGQVAARERVRLFGLSLVQGRRVDYSRYDPVRAREIFVRDGLVAGRLKSASRGLARNRERIAALTAAEARRRRPPPLADASRFADFYDRCVPSRICDAAGFERWIRSVERKNPAAIEAPLETLLDGRIGTVDRRDFPDFLEIGPLRLPLEYRFEPGAETDGLTVRLPLAALAQLDPVRAEWLVPGYLAECVEALLRTLPKASRRQFGPVAGLARLVAGRIEFGSGSLCQAIAEDLRRAGGIEVPVGDFRPDGLPEHLRLRYAVVDGDGEVLAADRDLAALRRRLGGSAPRFASGRLDRPEVRDWDFGDLPERVTLDATTQLAGYPALTVEGERVALRVFVSRDEAETAHGRGVLGLIRSAARAEIRELRRSASGLQARDLAVLGLGQDSLVDDLIDATLAESVGESGLPRTAAAYSECRRIAVRSLIAGVRGRTSELEPALRRAAQVGRCLRRAYPDAWTPAVADLHGQLAALFRPGFVRATPPEWRRRLPIYVMGMERRLERLADHPARDLARLRVIEPLRRRIEAGAAGGLGGACLLDVRFALEELRLQLFAQELGPRHISPQRVAARLASLGI